MDAIPWHMENAELESDSLIRGEEEHTTNSAASSSSPAIHQTATSRVMEDSNNQLLHDTADLSSGHIINTDNNQADSSSGHIIDTAAPDSSSGHIIDTAAPDSSSGHIIDTAAPFESVKAAVSKFGGFGDWKPHRAQDMEKPKFVEREVDKVQEKIPEYKKQLEDAEESKMQVLKELESTKTQIEELKLSLERAESQENEAKQDYTAFITRKVEELNVELIATKEALDSAHAAHLEARDKKIGAAMARDQDNEYLEKELKQTQEELQRLDRQIQSTNDLKLKHDTASALLLDLKAELAAAYMETDGLSNNSQDPLTSVRKDLQEVKLNIEKVTAEVDVLKLTADSLKIELRKEKSTLASIKQREEMASVAVASLEAELDKSGSQIAEVQTKETEELPKQVQKAAQVADEAKLLAQIAGEEMRKAKVEAEQAKATASSTERRLVEAQKEIEASEEFGLHCMEALQESESMESGTGVVRVPLDEYNSLTKRAHEAEEETQMRMEVAVCRMEEAKQAESRSLEKLKEVKREVGERKEALRCAMEKADRAKEQRKLGIEQELRKWRVEHEQLRKLSEKKEMNSCEAVVENPKPHANANANANANGNKTETESSPQVKTVKKKKKLIQRCSCLCPKRKSRK